MLIVVHVAHKPILSLTRYCVNKCAAAALGRTPLLTCPSWTGRLLLNKLWAFYSYWHHSSIYAFSILSCYIIMLTSYLQDLNAKDTYTQTHLLLISFKDSNTRTHINRHTHTYTNKQKLKTHNYKRPEHWRRANLKNKHWDEDNTREKNRWRCSRQTNI